VAAGGVAEEHPDPIERAVVAAAEASPAIEEENVAPAQLVDVGESATYFDDIGIDADGAEEVRYVDDEYTNEEAGDDERTIVDVLVRVTTTLVIRVDTPAPTANVYVVFSVKVVVDGVDEEGVGELEGVADTSITEYEDGPTMQML
jgi:hypothetical protein